MFETLTEKFNKTWNKLRGYGVLTEGNIEEALREVRLSLLEADVNYRIVKELVERVKGRALGQEVMESLTPGQQFIKIMRDELTALMGDTHYGLNLKEPVTVIMLVGLQGSGKTTTAAKLGNYLNKNGRRPILAAVDVRRPAAYEQLKILGERLNIEVFSGSSRRDPIKISEECKEYALEQGFDTVILDTAGRLHIDEEMMKELSRLEKRVEPQEILLVADAMTGQDAVRVAESFNAALNMTGVILTKMEGDARGGAALSIKAITGKPIKFIGIGEQLDALDLFHPDRMAGRIIGMGDVFTLIEKAEAIYEEEKVSEIERKLRTNTFTIADFRDQLVQLKKMGSLETWASMIPGMDKLLQGGKNFQPAQEELKKSEAIINSMTKKERINYKIINGSRRKRIAKGSGTTVQDVNRLLNKYVQMHKMIQHFNKVGLKGLSKELAYLKTRGLGG